MQRRTFVKMAGGVTAGMCLGCMSGCGSDSDEAPQKTGEQADKGGMEVKLADYPQLSAPGGWTVIEKQDFPAMLIVHTEHGQFAALSAKCTHMGALLQFDPAVKKIFCGLHHSEFDLTGQVQRGPASKQLAQYAVRQQGETLQISTQNA